MFILAGGERRNIVFRNPTGCVMRRDELPKDADEVWYADCCPDNMADPTDGLPFRVFDHHLSNARRHSADKRCIFDMDLSGTSLMARELGLTDDSDVKLFPELRRLISALEAYDLGRFDNADGQFLADLAATYTQDQMLDSLLDNLNRIFDSALLHARADAIAAVRKLYAEKAAEYARFVVIEDMLWGQLKVGVAVSPVYWKNEVALRILHSGRADLAMIIDPTSQMVSLRSLPGGPDCSVIAGSYGGGGHARAAGYKGNGEAMLQALMEEVF